MKAVNLIKHVCIIQPYIPKPYKAVRMSWMNVIAPASHFALSAKPLSR
jgi:hypothetical protein